MTRKFLIGNNFAMRKNEYVEKAKNSILNRVKFHAPVVYDDKIDKTILFNGGVDVTKPIFKFDKPLTSPLVKAFVLAQREEEFNLLISSTSASYVKLKELKKLANAVIFSTQNSPVAFVEMINKLNINYSASTNYNLAYKDKFFKVNGEILNPSYKEFVLRQNLVCDGVWVEYHEFLLNGENIFVKFHNRANVTKRLELELNIPLEKGYYFFKKNNGALFVENLLTKKKSVLNYIGRHCKFSFSAVDGLENSVYALVNVKMSLTLEGCHEKFVFFNFGDEKFSLKSLSQVKKFEELAKKKCCEIFNIKVKTKESAFDRFFNETLPKKIWLGWFNGHNDLTLQDKYLTLKRLFVRGEDKLAFVPFKKIGLQEIDIFNGQIYKKISIISAEGKFLKVGKTYFYNINGITSHTLKSLEPVCISFGDM